MADPNTNVSSADSIAAVAAQQDKRHYQGSEGEQNQRSQHDKFRDLAREVEADEDERAFEEKLRRMRQPPRDREAKGEEDDKD